MSISIIDEYLKKLGQIDEKNWSEFAPELGLSAGNGAIQVPYDKPIAESMLKLIITTRLTMIRESQKNHE